MILEVIQGKFVVCKIKQINQNIFESDFLFFSKTDKELSLVCREETIPKGYICCERGWKAFRVAGELDFSLVGILSELSSLLAKNKISIFAVSTYDTDYILIKETSFDEALEILKKESYQII